MMNARTREMRRAFWMLFTAFCLLIIIGTVNVFSSTFIEDMTDGGNAYSHLIRQGIFFVVGLPPALFIYHQDYRRWKKAALPGILIAAALLVAVLGTGVVVNGARRWLGVGGFTFQPSELAKLAIILFTAERLAPLWDQHRQIEFFYPISVFLSKERRKKQHWQWLKKIENVPFIPHPLLLPAVVLAALVIKQPDAGTALVILALPLAMFWVSGASLSRTKAPCLLAGTAGALYLVSAPYRMNRIIAWLDSDAYEKTLGYQAVQSKIAIGSGGIMGQGVGEGISKFSYLPEAHTDFAFAVLAQEWGMRGSIVILVLFAILIFFGCQCAWSTKDTFGKLMALGITFYFGGQGLINLAMVSAIFPVVGVPLPFISYGGTSLIINLCAAALLLNIAHKNYQESLLAAQAEKRPPLHSIREETRSRFRLRG